MPASSVCRCLPWRRLPPLPRWLPSLYEQSILFRFYVILLAGLFGVLGLTCAALMILAMACGSEPFGYDYLYPLMPPGKASVRDGFVRSIWSELAKAGGDRPP